MRLLADLPASTILQWSITANLSMRAILLPFSASLPASPPPKVRKAV